MPGEERIRGIFACPPGQVPGDAVPESEAVSGNTAEPLDCAPGPEQSSSRKHPAQANKTGIAAGEEETE
jgi:hypothetical protein